MKWDLLALFLYCLLPLLSFSLLWKPPFSLCSYSFCSESSFSSAYIGESGAQQCAAGALQRRRSEESVSKKRLIAKVWAKCRGTSEREETLHIFLHHSEIELFYHLLRYCPSKKKKIQMREGRRLLSLLPTFLSSGSVQWESHSKHSINRRNEEEADKEEEL